MRRQLFQMTIFHFGVCQDTFLLSSTKGDRVGHLFDNKGILTGKGAGMDHFTRLMVVGGSKGPLRRGGILVQKGLAEEIWEVYETHLSSEITRLGGENGNHQMVGGGENRHGHLEKGMRQGLARSVGGH